jgi:hypothetical protein
MLNSLEFVRESPSHDQLISSVFENASHLLHYDSFVILEDSDSLDQTVNLSALREDINLAFFVEHSLFSFRA